MKNTLLALLMPALFACSSVPGDENLSRVWQLRTKDGGATGFPIHQEPSGRRYRVYVLTVKHAAGRDPDAIWSASNGPRRLVGGRLLRLHPRRDAALLIFLADRPVELVSRSSDDLRLGERVLSVGYPGSRYLWITEGVVSAPDRISAPTWFGGSGSAVLGEEGRVRGMVVSVYTQANRVIEWQVLIIPLSAIEDWLP